MTIQSLTIESLKVQSLNAQRIKKQSLRVVLLGACLTHAAFAQFILTGISPNTGAAGSPTFDIILKGTFVSPPSVLATFGAAFTPPGGSPTSLTIVDTSATEIVATVPAALIALPGTATVFATEKIPGMPVTDSAGFPFTITTPTPFIDSLKPSTAALNGAGLSVGVIGSGYYAKSVVEWNGTALATAFDTAGLLTATVPAALLTTAGNQLITVSNGPGLISNKFAFLVSAPAPSISSINPATVPEGGPAVPLTVTGAGFLGGADCANGGCIVSAITFDGAALATTFVDRNHLVATIPVPSLTIGLHTVLVTEGEVSTGSLPFQVTALLPSVTALSPVSSVQDGAGFILTLNGTGFVGAPNCNGTNCVPSQAVFGSTNLPTTFISGTQLRATVPAALVTAIGSFPVTVVNNALVSSAVSFAVFAPVLGSLSPSAAVAGGPAFTLIAAGTGFQTTSTLTWNGTALATTFISATQLTATVPATLIAAAGNATVAVATLEASGGLTSNSLTFTIAAALVITSISPSTVTAGSAQLTMTVTGSGFPPGSVVQLNGSPLATTFVSGTTLTAVVPQSALTTPGTDSIVVVNPGAPVAEKSNVVTLTVSKPLVITSLSPNSAVAGGPAFTLTVTGTGFLPSSTITWNGVALATAFVSATELTALVPATLITEPESVSVAAANSTSTSNTLSFSVNLPGPPSLTLSTPPSVGPAQQPTVGFVLNSAYPLPLDGTVTLRFASDAAIPDDDPAIQFATGGRTLTFSLPANSTALPALNIQTGTVAGTITITVSLIADGVDVTPPGSTATIVILRAPPVITSVSLVRGASSVQLNVVGFATSREVVQGVFQFTPAANNTFTSANITVPLSTAFATWYESAPGASFGSQFMLSQPFSLGGNSDAVASVTLTLQNAVGTSQPATAK